MKRDRFHGIAPHGESGPVDHYSGSVGQDGAGSTGCVQHVRGALGAGRSGAKDQGKQRRTEGADHWYRSLSRPQVVGTTGTLMVMAAMLSTPAVAATLS